MLYRSTRNRNYLVPSAEAIKKGVAPDGGLFVPEQIVTVPLVEFNKMLSMSYGQRAIQIFEKFLTDFTDQDLLRCVAKSYYHCKFDHEDIAPVHHLTDKTFILELWHGPTCSFQDMALQIFSPFLKVARKNTNDRNHMVVLAATSGNTGIAALDGFNNFPNTLIYNTSIIVFFPEQEINQVQKLQMANQVGQNIHILAVTGKFEEVQKAVHNVLTDHEIQAHLAGNHISLSLANAVNWGCLLPQIIYYFSAYQDLQHTGKITAGEPVNLVVPTGNFANILAGWYAKQMGLPINKLICASNVNNVLTDFIQTGVYNGTRPLLKTNSPSLDILISSNIERLLFMLDGDESVVNWMSQLKTAGRYQVDSETGNKIKETFWAASADDQETLRTIKEVYGEHRYVIDPHTAVAVNVMKQYRTSTGDTTKSIVASTYSPFKFANSVVEAILGKSAAENKNYNELFQLLSETTGWSIPPGLKNLGKKSLLQHQTIEKEAIKQSINEILSI